MTSRLVNDLYFVKLFFFFYTVCTFSAAELVLHKAKILQCVVLITAVFPTQQVE